MQAECLYVSHRVNLDTNRNNEDYIVTKERARLRRIRVVFL